MSKKGICYGVSVGPGDPELITIRAFNTIKNADCIFLPNAPKEDCRVYQIIKGAFPEIDEKNIVCDMGSKMTNPSMAGERYDRLSKCVEEYLDDGYSVAFPALGAVALYSTFMYVHERLVRDGYTCELISGVSSIQETVRTFSMSIAQGDEEVHVFPDAENLNEKLSLNGTKVFMKPKGSLSDFTEKIVDYCINNPHAAAYGVSNLGTNKEIVAHGYGELCKLQGYMTVIIVKDV